jgi:hypothetical protein
MNVPRNDDAPWGEGVGEGNQRIKITSAVISNRLLAPRGKRLNRSRREKLFSPAGARGRVAADARRNVDPDRDGKSHLPGGS